MALRMNIAPATQVALEPTTPLSDRIRCCTESSEAQRKAMEGLVSDLLRVERGESPVSQNRLAPPFEYTLFQGDSILHRGLAADSAEDLLTETKGRMTCYFQLIPESMPRAFSSPFFSSEYPIELEKLKNDIGTQWMRASGAYLSYSFRKDEMCGNSFQEALNQIRKEDI